MSRESLPQRDQEAHVGQHEQFDLEAHDPALTKRASNAAIQKEVVQMKGAGAGKETAQDAAERGIRGSGGRLPHADRIQAAFGAHDVSGIQAHVDSGSADAMGAEAYATGNHVVFGRDPDLHTAAHEAAHVVQQQQGVQLKGGVGKAGDSYERNADEVADRVVQGKSAEDLLGTPGKSAAPTEGAIQRKPKETAEKDHNDSDYSSRDAIGASLKLLAKHFHTRGQELWSLVRGKHDTEAGTGPAMQMIPQIFEQMFSETREVSVMLGNASKIGASYMRALTPEISMVLGAYTRFAPAMDAANNWMQTEDKNYSFKNPYWIKQYVDDFTAKATGDKDIKLDPNAKEPAGTEAEVHAEAMKAHIEGAMDAVESAENGNTADATRVKMHIHELWYMARDHKSEMKQHKKAIATLVGKIKALEKHHPELKDNLEAALKELATV